MPRSGSRMGYIGPGPFRGMTRDEERAYVLGLHDDYLHDGLSMPQLAAREGTTRQAIYALFQRYHLHRRHGASGLGQWMQLQQRGDMVAYLTKAAAPKRRGKDGN